jgi:sialate O-acetylesterase
LEFESLINKLEYMKIKYYFIFWISASIIFFGLLSAGCHIRSGSDENNEFKTKVELKGQWKFSIGDNLKWAKPEYNDETWENIKVPSPWENEGFNGYDGFAWYRKHFKVSEDLKDKSIYFSLGTIDDADEVYVNGNMIGLSGSFPPNFKSEYAVPRMYPCPAQFLNFNTDNVIAVRVYDDQLEGGITSGDISIKIMDVPLPELNLEGLWKFSLGDSVVYKEINFPDKNWKNLFVPGYWENQGYNDYDGFAWYRKTFIFPDNLKDKKLLFLGGKIDDLDQVYINGVYIGSTGNMGTGYGSEIKSKPKFDQEYRKFRAYNIPDSLLIPGKLNTVAVRVYDGYLNGGMYQGPVGLIPQEKYTKFWHDHKNLFGTK